MRFLEEDLESIIFNTDQNLLIERGLCFHNYIKKRQLRIGNYGVADLVTLYKPPYVGHRNHDGQIEISVYELKKDELSPNAFFQAVRYVRGIQSYLSKRNFTTDIKYRIVLIGRGVPNNDLVYLPDVIGNDYLGLDIEVISYDYQIDGLKFTSLYGYSLINEGF